MNRWVVAMATLFVVSGCIAPSTPNLRAAPIINVAYSSDTVYYTVSGRTTQEILDSVEANGPELADVPEGRYTQGLTEADRSYEIEFLERGRSCEIQSAVIALNIVVTVPQHSDPSSLTALQMSR